MASDKDFEEMLLDVTVEAERRYEVWKKKHPKEDPVTNRLPDALWRVSRICNYLRGLLDGERLSKR